MDEHKIRNELDMLMCRNDYGDAEGNLFITKIKKSVLNCDRDFIKLILSNNILKNVFFDEIEGYNVFNQSRFFTFLTTGSLKKIDKKITQNAYVAFFDIMGFKDRIMRKSHEENAKLMYHLCDLIEMFNNESYNIVKGAVFSDSIVLFSDEREYSIFCLLSFAAHFFATAFINGIPMKGAIAYGKTTVDLEKSLFFGQPIIDAFQLEEDLNYYGVVVHHTAEKELNKNTSGVFDSKTFFKQGEISHLNIDYFSELRYNMIFDDNVEIKELINKTPRDKEVEQVLNYMRLNVSGEPRKYIDNTMEMYERYKNILSIENEDEEDL